MKKVPNILVIGDLMIDHYLWGGCERISPEAPVQVIDVKREENLLGGAGNVLNNLIALGTRAGVCSVIGDDKEGEIISNLLGQKGVVKEGLIVKKGRRTTKKSRIIALNQQIARVDKEQKDPIDDSLSNEILKRVEIVIDFYDLLLLSDYDKGVLSPYLTKELINLAKKRGKMVLVDPKGSDFSKYKGATLLTPNKKEAMEALGMQINDKHSLTKALKNLKDELDLKYSLITLSQDGIAFFEESLKISPTVAKEVYDVTGAGDTVLASLAFALSKGERLEDAVDFANAAAAVVVSKVGSATATLYEIKRVQKDDLSKKIVSLQELLEILPKQKRVVFTNGCFDILHAGHVSYLQKAKSFGDVLVVGLNSDESVRRLKGDSRPINSQDDRAVVLSGLESVDFVVIFDEDTPYDLIKDIKPDILVKGADYEGKEVVGSDIAKETRLVEFVEGRSTTKIIERIGKS